MVDRLVAESKRQYCASERGNKILAKTSGHRFLKRIKNEEVIMKDLFSDTEAFLKMVVKDGEDNTLIYN